MVLPIFLIPVLEERFETNLSNEAIHATDLVVIFDDGSDDHNAATILAARQLGYTGEILALVEDSYHRQRMVLVGASGAYTPRHVLGAGADFALSISRVSGQ